MWFPKGVIFNEWKQSQDAVSSLKNIFEKLSMKSVPTIPPRCGPGNISANYENSEVQPRGCSVLTPWCLQIPASLNP